MASTELKLNEYYYTLHGYLGYCIAAVSDPAKIVSVQITEIPTQTAQPRLRFFAVI